MKLADVRNNEGRVTLRELKNRYSVTEYEVYVRIKGYENKTYVYKNIESAMKKYKKATKKMNELYLAKCV